jgi:phosphoribosylanthranilate isomerase
VTRVKICGVRELEHALAAVEAGADLLGFIFYRPARRYVDPALAAHIADVVRGRAEVVGVFVNEDPASMREIGRLVGLDLIQLSGDEPTALHQELDRPIARTVHVDATTSVQEIARRTHHAALIHLDTKRAGRYGGTGERFDWRIARAAAELGPVLLAGGLDPANVGEAIALAEPWGVDVSSGVETAGVKDPAKIEAFVRAAKGYGVPAARGARRP